MPGNSHVRFGGESLVSLSMSKDYGSISYPTLVMPVLIGGFGIKLKK